MADDLDRLLEKAREENQKAQSRKKQAPQKPRPAEQPVTPDDDERYSVYRRLSPARISIIEFALVAGLCITFVTMWVVGQSDPLWVWKGYDMCFVCSVAFAGFLALRLLYTELYAFFTFSRFRKWRKQLPYRLEGWQELVDMPHFGKAHWWRRECTLRVTITSENENVVQGFNDLAALLCRNCNKGYYTAFSSDPRISWSLDGHQLRGSVNGAVARKIYDFLRKDMTLMAERYGQPVKITITVRGDVEEVAPESSD
jgi:hypothetical protein